FDTKTQLHPFQRSCVFYSTMLQVVFFVILFPMFFPIFYRCFKDCISIFIVYGDGRFITRYCIIRFIGGIFLFFFLFFFIGFCIILCRASLLLILFFLLSSSLFLLVSAFTLNLLRFLKFFSIFCCFYITLNLIPFHIRGYI